MTTVILTARWAPASNDTPEFRCSTMRVGFQPYLDPSAANVQ